VEDLNGQIVDAYCDALLNEAYYRKLAAKAAWWDRLIRIFVGICSASAVLTLLAKLEPTIAGVLTAATAIASAVGLVMRLDARARKLEALAAEWTGVTGRVKLLDLESGVAETARRQRLLKIVEESELLQARDTEDQRDALVKRLEVQVREQLSNRLAPPALPEASQ